MTLFMLRSLPRRAGRAAIVMSAVLAPAMPAQAQYAVGSPTAVESPEAALARNVRLIASNPRNFQALVAAGRAALGTGDTQAAVGFFGRAEEISPTSWQPQAGMAAAMVAMGDPRGALIYFARAQQYGATQMQIAVDRGLGFDLMGDQAKAQSDYRAALPGAEADEARRRLALSLAISGDIRGASATIEPLLRRRDPEAVRANAFILAFAGDREGARRTIDAFMPGAGMRFEPFFKVLPALRADEKAAAVHLGIFPKDAAQRYAQLAQPQARPQVAKTPPVKVAENTRQAVRQAPPPSPSLGVASASLDPSRRASTRQASTQSQGPEQANSNDSDPEPRPAGRLDDIAQLLGKPTVEEASNEALVKVAEAQSPEPLLSIDLPPLSKTKVETTRPKAASKPKSDPKAERLAAEKKAKAEAARKAKAEAARLGVAGTNWVQIAGGSNQDRMSAEYRKLVAKAGSLLKSRSGYVTQGKDYFRLLVGPFDSADDAQAFVRKLDKAGVDSFRWTRNPAQIRIEKLKS